VLLAGGHGGLQIFPNGSMKWGDNNFLVRTRQQFADQGLFVAVVDAPSDRQSPPFLGGFRQKPEHAEDLRAVIAWVREQAKVPVWLVGTSRGTQSAAFVATELSSTQGPDGIVLSSTILVEEKGRPVPAMPLGKLRIPVLVVHHEQDGCSHCPFSVIRARPWRTTGSTASSAMSSRRPRPGSSPSDKPNQVSEYATLSPRCCVNAAKSRSECKSVRPSSIQRVAMSVSMVLRMVMPFARRMR